MSQRSRTESPGTPSLGKLLIWVGVLCAASAAAVTIDLRVQRSASTVRPPGMVRDYFNATEAFGNGFGVLMILLAVVVLQHGRRVQLARLLAASLGAGLVADIVKMTVGRYRPGAVDVDKMLAAGCEGWDTFVGALPLASLGSAGQSFPSAHTATAFGLATVLSWVHPKGARLFYSFAAGVALQRVCTDAHYLSDVLAGAVVGLLWGHACFGGGVLARRFDAMEAWWSRRFGWVLPAGHARLDEADSEPDLVALPTPGERTPAPIRRAA